MKKKIIGTAAAAVMLVGGTTADAAAVTVEEARWQGTFDVTQTFLEYTLNPEQVGEQSERVHTITSTCEGTTACDFVKFSRVSGAGDKYTYRLKRVEPGTYKGTTTYESSWWCARRSDGKRLYTWTGSAKETLTLTARAQKAGKVTKYRGILRILDTPYEINSDVPQKCQDYFASQGMEEGDRPVQKLSLIGVLR